MSNPSIALIGAGAAGTSLALALAQAGHSITAVCSRRIESARQAAALLNAELATTDPAAAVAAAKIVVIATPDGQIAPVSQMIADTGQLSADQLFLHLSGALTTQALKPIQDQGVQVLAFHPIQSMSDPVVGASLLQGSYFCLQGEATAIARGQQLVTALNGHTLVIPRDKKPLYHAALSVCSNYLVALESIAVNMLNSAGIDEPEALKALLPLIKGTVANLEQEGLLGALTGPINRGDASTLEQHLRLLADEPDSTMDCYKLLGREAIRLADKKGRFGAEERARLERLLT